MLKRIQNFLFFVPARGDLKVRTFRGRQHSALWPTFMHFTQCCGAARQTGLSPCWRIPSTSWLSATRTKTAALQFALKIKHSEIGCCMNNRRELSPRRDPPLMDRDIVQTCCYELTFTQALLLSEDFTQAETKAIPKTPSLMLGSGPLCGASDFIS